MKDLLEAGVHFGHQTKRWNPKMKEYIFGERNGIYILDLGKTVKLFKEAEDFVTNLAAEGKTLLFVGTKRQAQDVIAEEAVRCSMYFVNQRWLGGLLTNFQTVQKSIKRLKDLEALAMGLPAIVGRCSGAAEIMRHGENGWICESEDVAGLANLMHAAARVAADDIKREAARAAARSTAERYGIDDMARKLIDLYGMLKAMPGKGPTQ